MSAATKVRGKGRRPARTALARSVLSFLAIGALFSACTNTASGPSGGKTFTITFGTPNPGTAVDTKAVIEWAKKVKEDTHGAVVIKEYPNDQLGTDATEMTAVQHGSQQGFAGTTADLENYTKVASVLDLPYMFPRAEADAKPMLFGDVGDRIRKDVESSGFEIVGWLDEGARDLISKKPITKPQQLKGVKVRVIPAPIPEGQYKALGADTNPIAFSEVYSALETNVVSALDEPVDDLYQKKFYQHVCCLAKTADVLTVNAMVLNKAFWDGIPAKYQKIIADDAATIMKAEWDDQVKGADEDIAVMKKKGLQVRDVDINEWVKAWQPFDDAYVRKLPKDVQSLYREIRSREQAG